MKHRTLTVRRADVLRMKPCAKGIRRADELGVWPLKLSTDPEKNLALAMLVEVDRDYSLYTDLTWLLEQLLNKGRQSGYLYPESLTGWVCFDERLDPRQLDVYLLAQHIGASVDYYLTRRKKFLRKRRARRC